MPIRNNVWLSRYGACSEQFSACFLATKNSAVCVSFNLLNLSAVAAHDCDGTSILTCWIASMWCADDSFIEMTKLCMFKETRKRIYRWQTARRICANIFFTYVTVTWSRTILPVEYASISCISWVTSIRLYQYVGYVRYILKYSILRNIKFWKPSNS